MKTLINGGAGFIGATTAKLFAAAGHDVVIYDNFSTGHKHNVDGLTVINGDSGDVATLAPALKDVDVVLDFAAKIRVDESMEQPKLYYTNNTFDALTVIDEAVKAGVKNFILSSTAAVYGNPEDSLVTEKTPTNPVSPYGISKLIAEQLLRSYEITHNLNWTAFRYFNAAGASGRIGPDYTFRSHLIPSVIYAQQTGEAVKLFGDDYNTPDGTAVRDYIHVEDIGRAHVMAAEKMLAGATVCQPVNLGTKRGSSVLEIVKAVERISGKPIEHKNVGRRAGDAAAYYASNDLAKSLFGWRPQKSLDEIVKDALDWQNKYKPL